MIRVPLSLLHRQQSPLFSTASKVSRRRMNNNVEMGEGTSMQWLGIFVGAGSNAKPIATIQDLPSGQAVYISYVGFGANML